MDLKKIKNSIHHFRVLYVEDNLELREAQTELLKDIFSQVESASNGLDGLKCYKNGTFDLVITDINMPIMDGIKMVEKIKKLNPTQKCIVISAYKEFEYLEKVKRLDIDLFLTKPVDLEELLKSIYRVLYQKEIA